jgi:hypothetical protein
MQLERNRGGGTRIVLHRALAMSYQAAPGQDLLPVTGTGVVRSSRYQSLTASAPAPGTQ